MFYKTIETEKEKERWNGDKYTEIETKQVPDIKKNVLFYGGVDNTKLIW